MARPIAKLVTLCCLTLAGLSQPVLSQEDNSPFTTTTLAEGLVHPWGMAFMPNGDMLVTERPGGIRILTAEGVLSERLGNVPDVVANNQGGMLDIAIDPDFVSNNTLYFCFSQPGEGGSSSSVAKATLSDNALSNVEVIFSATPRIDNGFHFGCRLAFDRNDALYVTLGDRYKYMKEAQNPGNHFGTIVRINKDGSVPKDNPFTDGTAPEVYSYGHRNVQGITMHPDTGVMWAMEHGPKGGDEVNILKKGANYGWPTITYGIDYSGEVISDKTHMKDMEQPWLYWDPSIAPSGMTFYYGDMFPQWQGDLLVGSLKFTHLRRIEVTDNAPGKQHEYLRDSKARIRDVEVGPKGAIYVLTDTSEGKIIKLTPAN